jgi:hypothetical protein
MKLRNTWGMVLLATVAVSAAAASCSAVQPNTFTGTGGSSSGPGSTSAGTAGSGVGGLFGTGGGTTTGSTTGSGGNMPGQCDTSCADAGGQCLNGTCSIKENPGNVDPGLQTTLQNGGSSGNDPGLRFLYPYDKTIFPRGLLPPSIQLDGNPPEATYLHIHYPGFDYKGFYGASSPGRVLVSEAVWKALTLSATGKVDVQVDITKSSGGLVTGPITETWGMAKGSLRGVIYYETYDSQILGGVSSVGIMKIQPGSMAPTPVKSGCGNVCHTVSADGSTLVAATFLTSSASYDLKNNAAVLNNAADQRFTYGALTPDGSLTLSAANYRTFFGFGGSHLYDTKTGAQIPAPGWDGVINNPGTPAFSPDGKKVAFNHEDTGGGHTLAVMDFDMAQKKFTNLVDVASDPAGFLGWPAFTPDTKSVVYHAGTNAQFETDNQSKGDLFAVDVQSHQLVRLDALDGYKNGQSYLPASDPQLSFAPTVLPEAVGGYFWVVFTSHRSYGNTLPSQDHNDEYGKLWVAAYDIDAAPGTDPSHPAFYLDGQEQTANNLRGFWVLDPCKPNGTDCASGDECCDGYCRDVDGGPPQCSPMSGGCSHEYEKCTTAADCCDSGFQCINGHCAQPPPPK